MHPSFSFRERPACLTASSPNWGVNSALALIEAAEPRNEIEGALALQMACTHIASSARQRRRPSAHRECEQGEQRRGRRRKLSVRAPGGPRALCSFIPFAPLPCKK